MFIKFKNRDNRMYALNTNFVVTIRKAPNDTVILHTVNNKTFHTSDPYDTIKELYDSNLKINKSPTKSYEPEMISGSSIILGTKTGHQTGYYVTFAQPGQACTFVNDGNSYYFAHPSSAAGGPALSKT